MIRKLLTYTLLLIHLAFLILPEIPFVMYLMGHSQKHPQTADAHFISGDRPLTGDITFLRALIERTKETNKKTEKPIMPERVTPNFVLFYHCLAAAPYHLLKGEKWIFMPFQDEVISRYLTTPSPPPRFS